MSDIKYTEEYEWLSVENDIITVGITDFAQQLLGDVVNIELPEEGGEFKSGDEVVIIESMNAVSEIAVPLDGKIVEVNEALVDAPELVNYDPMGLGWFFKMHVADGADTGRFMCDAEYRDLIADY
ncbi:MAG: glycine cleavage system protein GcvH [Gammaproteobacteria bacterium]